MDRPRRVQLRRRGLRAVQPNAGVTAAYRRRLRKLIAEMHASVLYWVKAAWRSDPPATLAEDAAAGNLRKAIRELRKRWEDRFDEASERLADYFAKDVDDRSTAQLKRILRDGGLSVKFKMTPEMRDALDATVGANVALIKSIPAKYLDEVEGAVMRSVQVGQDVGGLTKFIEKEYGLARKRAALIAMDQNSKATSAMVSARQTALGIDWGIWQHSHAGKEPRPTHVAMDGKKFRIAEGMYDKAEGRKVKPGELIRCRCTWRPLIPGVSE